MRNPGRTAATAAALMIGLALVTFVAVLGASLRSSVGDAVERTVRAGYVVTSPSEFETLSPEADSVLSSNPTVTAVSPVRLDSALVDGAAEDVTALDPVTASEVLAFDWTSGSETSLRRLGSDGAILQSEFAGNHELAVGDQFQLVTLQGRDLDLVVRGIYDPPRVDPLLAPVSISIAAFDSAFERPQNIYTLVNVAGGADDW